MRQTCQDRDRTGGLPLYPYHAPAIRAFGGQLVVPFDFIGPDGTAATWAGRRQDRPGFSGAGSNPGHEPGWQVCFEIILDLIYLGRQALRFEFNHKTQSGMIHSL